MSNRRGTRYVRRGEAVRLATDQVAERDHDVLCEALRDPLFMRLAFRGPRTICFFFILTLSISFFPFLSWSGCVAFKRVFSLHGDGSHELPGVVVLAPLTGEYGVAWCKNQPE